MNIYLFFFCVACFLSAITPNPDEHEHVVEYEYAANHNHDAERRDATRARTHRAPPRFFASARLADEHRQAVESTNTLSNTNMLSSMIVLLHSLHTC